MLIEEHQINALEQRIQHNFTHRAFLVYEFTDYFHHHFYVKKGSLFKAHKLPKFPPQKNIQQEQQRLRDYRREFKAMVRDILIQQEPMQENLQRYEWYIQDEMQLLLNLSRDFCLIREEDEEFAKTQTLFIIRAVHQDFSSQNNLVGFQAWLLGHLQPYIDIALAINGRSKQELLAEIEEQNQLLQENADELENVYQQLEGFESYKTTIAFELQQLDLKNQLLGHQLLTMQQRCAQLEHQVANPQPTMVPSRYVLGSTSSIVYSSAVRGERMVKPNFHQAVLALPTRGLETAFLLEPLQGRIPEEEEDITYFRQYPDYILEEIRSNLDAQMKTIGRKRLVPFVVTIEMKKLQDNPTTELVQVSCWAYARALPKLDHGFYQEAVLVLTEMEHQRNPCYREFQNDTPLTGFLAIASAKERFDDEDILNKRVDIKLIFPLEDYERHQSSWKKSRGQLKLHWLHGLIPSSRMYDICLSPPAVMFQQQFTRGQLLEWPNVSDDTIKPAPEVSRLNPLQQQVVQRLVRVEPGLYFLQGPPGTGKTTTAASLLAQLCLSYPEHRILVCAPSNQAVRVLLFSALALMRDVSMALTGVAKNIPEGLENVFVHKYAYHLYDYFIAIKKQLIKENSRQGQTKLLAQITEHYQVVLNKMSELVNTESKMTISSGTKEQIEFLYAELLTQEEEFKNLQQGFFETFSAEKKDAIVDQVEATIQTIQGKSHYLESFLIQRSQLVFATLISSGRDWLRKQVSFFNIVVLDEAAQALVPEALIPLRFNPTIYIQIGDPNQLPATIVSKKAQEGGFANSMMHWLTKEYKQPYEMLTIQYRMLPAICDWPSKQYYHDRLITADEVITRPGILLQNKKLAAQFKNACLFFNITSGNEQRYGHEQSASISNYEEAKAVVAMAGYLIFKCNIDAKNIGIITFYSAQVEVLKKELKRQLRYDKQRDLTVSTVDGFQGEERDITLISVVRTSDSVGFLNDQRRLNVAMTRAKEARWVFGLFKPLNQSNSDLPSLLHTHKQEQIIEEAVLRQQVRIN